MTTTDEYSVDLHDFISALGQQPDREAVASELEVLQSIYGDDSIQFWHPETGGHPIDVDVLTSETIRYEVSLNLASPYEDVPIRILVSIPQTYPATSPPQMQLLSRYIGAFGADSTLFGSVLRIFMSISGVEWTPDAVCVFDGLQNALELCTTWYEGRLSSEKAGGMMREDARELIEERSDIPPVPIVKSLPIEPVSIPEGIEIIEAEAITDRKSTFIGRACRISHPAQVPLILSYLMSDRRISRAAHPIINAWRCQVGNLLHQDNDDDGETAAGGRLAHLLQILEVNNVIIIVTRYFGGIHLGPDRFKHINQAARNALDLGGFLDSVEPKKNSGRGKKR